MIKRSTIIENSLSNKNILKKIEILKTWKDEDWVLHDVLVDDSLIPELTRSMADGPWYIHMWSSGDDEFFVLFKNRTFQLRRLDRGAWADAIAYGKSIGIPEAQLDFPID
jgi:hypothetical protein